jgi:acetoin utilization protein AcuB
MEFNQLTAQESDMRHAKKQKPGLSLLKAEQTIEEFTTPDPVTVKPEASVDEVLRIFREFGFRHIPVVKDGRAVGIISDRDILLARPLGVTGTLRAKEVMTSSPYSASIDSPLEEIALELSHRKFGSVLVYDRKDKFYGIFTATDALNALVEILRNNGSIPGKRE